MKCFLILAITITISFLRCTSNNPSLAGPSTELGNPVFTGLVLYNTLLPAVNATVTIYKITSISNSSAVNDTLGIEFASFDTDLSGMFSLDNISAGEYLIKSYTKDSSLTALIKVTLQSGNNATIHDTLILSSPGTLRGVVSRGGQQLNSGNNQVRDGDIRIVLTELNQSAITGPDGVFSFSNVPEGIYSLAIYPDDNFFSQVRKEIQVRSSLITSVDTIQLDRIPWVKPPKPKMLQMEYDTSGASVKLRWNAVHIDNLLGYVVERRLEKSILDPVETFTKDTIFLESLVSYPKGTNIYYSVRSITLQFEKSYPEGPVNIIVAQ